MDILNTLKKISLKASDPDEATLREAGVHDSCGDLTAEGFAVLCVIIEKTIKADMVALAKEIIAASKKN